jgi:hypothetical protein
MEIPERRVTAAVLADWLHESESGIERWTKKGLFEPGLDGLFNLMSAVQDYVAYWQRLSALVEGGKERIVSGGELGEFLLLDRGEIAELVLAGVFTLEAPDRFALLRSTKAFATEIRASLGRD